ncbi:DUF6069 family protein [Micromonospora sp. NPDC092111]|uniref:DUF6069 family protein n=1 Tax=Micromonospora sp. NPDC092111 TaxID=3364289 RepID=UPI00380A1A37
MSATTRSVTTGTATPSLKRRALGVAVTVLACALIWVVGAIAGVDYTVLSPGRPAFVVGLAPVLLFALASALIGWVGLIVLERVTGRWAGTVWTALAVAIALLSLIPVFAVEATVGAQATLTVLHLAVAAALIAFLPARSR